MILGNRNDATPDLELVADRLYLSEAQTEAPVVPAFVAARLDGQGSGSGQQAIRAVIYSVAGTLLTSGDVVTVQDGDPAAWVTLPIPVTAQALDVGWRFGVHAGAASGLARIARGTGSSATADAPFVLGSPQILPATTAGGYALSMVAQAFQAWHAPDVTDAELARLPLPLAEQAFAGSAELSRAAVSGWHHTGFDAETGANAIVRSDGPLAGLVGERLRVSTRNGRAGVVVYCHDERDFPAETASEDMSLTRSAFMRLAPLWTTSLLVNVEIVL